MPNVARYDDAGHLDRMPATSQGQDMTNDHPDTSTIRAALALAVRAPSVHNTQPWLWRVGDRSVHLYADPSRQLPHADPDGRDLIVSCGAALHHFAVASAAAGWQALIHRLPNPDDQDHLAAVQFHPITPTAEMELMAQAIGRRRTDRRRFTSWEVPAAEVAELMRAGQECGVLVADVAPGPERAALLRAFNRAESNHARDGAYGSELAEWSGRHAADEGVPAHSAVVATETTARRYSNPTLAQAVVHDLDAIDHLLVLSTTSDDRMSRLRAGEAASAILLTATARGLASCALSEPLEIRDTCRAIRREVLHDGGYPQLIIRTGWAMSTAQELPPTPRRHLDDVISSLERA